MEDILSLIKQMYEAGENLYVSEIKIHKNLYETAQKKFGSWKKAVEAAGIDYSKFSRNSYSKRKIIEKLQNMSPEELESENLRNNKELYKACKNLFGSRKNAIIAAGLNYEESLLEIAWTKDKVLSTIQTYYLNGVPLNFKSINEHNVILRRRAEKIFGSWGEAIKAAGLDYDEIKKNKGWGKPLLSEDGILYSSQLEGLVANELFDLKKENRIKDYVPQQQVIPGESWACDFLVSLNNGSKLWLEVGENDKEDKLAFYDKANYFYYKVISHTSIKNIIDRFTTWYSIPNQDALITTHKNPDGDALASCRAVYNYLLRNKKKAAIRLSGDIPKNLSWIIDGCKTVKKVPEWAQLGIVLDCEPTEERMGWKIDTPALLNIDHHTFRVNDNDPDNNIHVIRSCSTAAILFSRFGIKDDILAVGVYTDTLFTKYISEVFHLLNDMKVSEETLSNFISKINSNPDKKIWTLIKNGKTHRCRNGFTIMEIEEDSPDVVESIMQILSKLSEAVCLIYGNKMVKIRTSNPELDVSVIAKMYSGGGHPFAAMANVDGKVNEFKNTIISWNVPKVDIQVDGYAT